jgi:hypothetical protein
MTAGAQLIQDCAGDADVFVGGDADSHGGTRYPRDSVCL